MFPHLEVFLPEKPVAPKNIGEDLKGPQRKFWKEDLFVQYHKNQNSSLILDPISIKSLPEVTKVLRSIIYPSTNEDDCSDAWKFVTRHCANGSSHIQDIGFDQSYSPISHTYSVKINIAISAMHILTARILDSSNAFHNTNVTIHGKLCVSSPPYYLE